MELLIVSISTQCMDDQEEYAKFVMRQTFWKIILHATCATGFVVCVVQSQLYIEKILAISMHIVKRRYSYLLSSQVSLWKLFDGYLYSLVGYELIWTR
jgi:hypothetical protein